MPYSPSGFPLNTTITLTFGNNGAFAPTQSATIVETPAALTEGQFTATESGVLAGRIVATVDAGVVVPIGWEIRLYAGSVSGQTAPAAFLAGAVLTPGTPFTTPGTFPAGQTSYARTAWRRINDNTIHSLGDEDAVAIAP